MEVKMPDGTKPETKAEEKKLPSPEEMFDYVPDRNEVLPGLSKKRLEKKSKPDGQTFTNLGSM